MVPLAWALRAAGHEVRMTSQPELLPTMRNSGLPATVIGQDLDIASTYRVAHEQVSRSEGVEAPPPREDRISDRLAPTVRDPRQLPSLRILSDFEDEQRSMFSVICIVRSLTKPWRLSLYGQMAQTMVSDLLALVDTWRPDLIVYDPLTFAGPIAAKVAGVPAVRNLFGPDVTYFLKVNGLADVLDQYGLDGVELLGTATVDPSPPSLQLPDSIAPTRRIHTRYVPYSESSEVPAWVNEPPSRPRICLTWGTSIHRLFGDDAFLPGRILDTCAKLADERGAELVLALTANQRHLVPDLPAGVRVAESVPLWDLLGTCDAIIHQGGAGTTLTALRRGLPQLILTQLADQAVNAFQLVATGAGQTLAATGLDAADLLRAGHDLLDVTAYRAAATRVCEEIEALPTPADIVDDLVALA
jgi:glycosyltransferase